MRLGLAAAALLVLLLAPSALAAAPAFDVAPERDYGAVVAIAPEQFVTLNFTVVSRGEEPAALVVEAVGPIGWNVSALPASFQLPNASSGEVRSFSVRMVPPPDAAPGAYEVQLRLTALNPDAEATRTEVPIALRITHSALVLGLWANPLGPPLDNAYGIFLLDLLFWAVIAAALVLLQDRIVAWLTRHAEKSVSARVVRDLRKPMWLGLVFFGFTQAWGALEPAWWVDIGHRILAAATILVTMYVVYKVFRAVLTYYVENVAARTESTLDDILVPVFEKVGAVVIVVGGILYFIGTLGIDLGAFIAGGVVVSMVLAFAAQDTLSNFFAGLFLMLDRPFGRGDDILLVTGGPLTNEVFRVEQVGLRSTRLYHYKNHQLVVMPNNDLAKNPVVNLMYPDHRYRVHLPVQVNYGVHVDQCQEILERCAREHPKVDSSAGSEPFAALEGFGDSGLNFTLLFFVRDLKLRGRVGSDVREAILREFAARGITIPFPQREVRIIGGFPGGPGSGNGPAGAQEGAQRTGTGSEPTKRS